jgi:hypothetical protein
VTLAGVYLYRTHQWPFAVVATDLPATSPDLARQLVDQQALFTRLTDDLQRSRHEARANRRIADELLDATNSDGSEEGDASLSERNAQTVTRKQALFESAQTPDADAAFADTDAAEDWQGCKSNDFSAVDYKGLTRAQRDQGFGQCYTDKIKAALRQHAQEATRAYQDCLIKIGDMGAGDEAPPAEWRETIADDGTESPKFQRILERAAQQGQDAAASCKHAYDEVKQAKSAEKAIASAMSMAASVCFASGANPYVCGAMLVIAIIMDEFGSGNGDGQGPVGDTGDQSAASDSSGGGGGTAYLPPPPSRPVSVSAVNGAGGTVHCTVTGTTSRGVWTCEDGGAKTTIDIVAAAGAPSLAYLQDNFISRNTTLRDGRTALIFCDQLKGLAFADKVGFTGVPLPIQADKKLSTRARSLEEACGRVVAQ